MLSALTALFADCDLLNVVKTVLAGIGAVEKTSENLSVFSNDLPAR